LDQGRRSLGLFLFLSLGTLSQSVFDIKLDLVTELLSKLDALILVIGGFKSLIDLSVVEAVENLLNFSRSHTGILPLEDQSHLMLEVSDFLVNVIEVSTDLLLLFIDTLANEENLLLQRCHLILRQFTRGLLLEDMFGQTLSLINL
jgi:hypothetical protein